MTLSTADLRRTIAGAQDLQSVVRTMKAFAASNLGQYESAVGSLKDYSQSVERGLGLCLRAFRGSQGLNRPGAGVRGAVVFGSDQGLVGRFNETVAQRAWEALEKDPVRPVIWSVGDRVRGCLDDLGLPSRRCYPVPTSVQAVGPLIGEILYETQQKGGAGPVTELVLYSNRPLAGFAYEPARLVLFPWEESWAAELVARPWPPGCLPELQGLTGDTFQSLVRECLFVGLFRACAGSLASENAARLAAMQRAEKNIDEMLVSLQRDVQRLRQSSIDEELFDVISGAGVEPQ